MKEVNYQPGDLVYIDSKHFTANLDHRRIRDARTPGLVIRRGAMEKFPDQLELEVDFAGTRLIFYYDKNLTTKP